MLSTMNPQSRITDVSMAKKRPDDHKPSPAAKPHASEVRYQTLTLANIELSLVDAEEALAEIRQTIAKCKEKNISAIRIDGATKFERGNDLLADFSSNLSRGASKAISQKRRDELAKNAETT